LRAARICPNGRGMTILAGIGGMGQFAVQSALRKWLTFRRSRPLVRIETIFYAFGHNQPFSRQTANSPVN
jgi:hypothetical protein